jgi:L-arabinonolactonase
MVSIERVSTIKNSLGEGPVWDADTEALFWVDSYAGEIFRLKIQNSTGETELKSWSVPCMIGSLAVVDHQRLIVALQTGFHFFDLDSGQLASINDPEEGMSETRFNDGKTDRAGNFLAGSMGIKIRDRALASLYRVNTDLNIETLEDDVVVANGPCFSPDGSTLYFNDGRRRILAYDYDPTGPLTNKRVIFEGEKYNTGSDGATVDSDGNLWVGLTGSSEIGMLSPEGDLLERIAMPINLPSSVMFGGPDLDQLFVTSISNSGNRVSSEDGAGGLYKISGLGVRGIAETRFQPRQA